MNYAKLTHNLKNSADGNPFPKGLSIRKGQQYG